VSKTADASYKIEELPFSHPRQLIAALPVLRQWAWLGSLLSDVFTVDTQHPSHSDESTAKHEKSTSEQPISLTDLLTPPAAPQTLFASKTPISISLVTSPIPTISLNFPTGAVNKLDNICVQVLPNAELVVTSQEGSTRQSDGELMDDSPISNSDEISRMKLALEACGNLSVWIEWLRRRETDP